MIQVEFPSLPRARPSLSGSSPDGFKLSGVMINFEKNPKTMRAIPIAIFLGAMLFAPLLSAQSMRAAFQLGRNEAAYEKLCQEYMRTLPAVSGNDMTSALGSWFELMREIENYAKSINVDIKGVKMQMHVFWNADGSVAHIGYFILPDSRNVPEEDMTALFSSFIRDYNLRLSKGLEPVATSDKKFSHYTGVTFPTFIERTK